MNKVILMGNLGADAELRMTGGGKPVMNFQVATSESWKDQSGQKQERTEWHRCVMWGDRAEKLAKHLTKGTKLVVEGSIRYSKYEKNGETRYATDINVERIEFAGSKRDTQTSGPSDYAGGYQKKNEEKQGALPVDDDIPF